MAIANLIIPYPDFVLGNTMDPDQFDANNEAIRLKVDEISGVVNTYPDISNTPKLDANQTFTGTNQFNEILVGPVVSLASPTRKDYVDDLDAANVKLTGDQSIAGYKTFTNELIVAEPTLTTHATTKNYVDGAIAGVVLGQIPDDSLTEAKMAPEMKKQAGGVAEFDTVANIAGNVTLNTSRTVSNTNGVATNSARLDVAYAHLEIDSKLAPTSGKFYDFPGATNQFSQGEIDLTKSYCETVTQGTDNVTVSSMNVGLITDLITGMEITLQDDTSKETLIIQSVADPVITFTTNIVNTYTTGANVYRSNIKVDGDVYKFGGFSATEEIDRTTPVQVVNAAYDTSGNGGRKVGRLQNGWEITSALDVGGNTLHIYKSEDNFATAPTELFTITTAVTDWALAFDDNVIKIIISRDNLGTIYSGSFDALTVVNENKFGELITIDTSQNNTGNCSLAIDPNDPLHMEAVASTKNATYPNSFNIRNYKTTDGGATWDTPTQVSVINSTGTDFTAPSIVVNSLGFPVIACAHKINTSYRITAYYFNGSVWGSTGVGGSFTSYVQSNPSADTLSDGTIIVGWTGRDATYPSVDNQKFSQSTDDGATWLTAENVTVGNSITYPRGSITRDKDDNIYHVVYQNTTGGVFYYKGTQGNWGSELTIDASALSSFPSTLNNYRDFTNPLTIYKGVGATVDFYGKWTEGTETDLTDVDIRMEITPLVDVSDIGAYINLSNNINTVDGQVSIVDSASNESYTDLVDTRYSIDANDDEVASLLNSSLTAEDKVTLKYILNRTLTTDVIEINSILGGVS